MNRSRNKTVGDLIHERPKQWGLIGDCPPSGFWGANGSLI